MTSHPPRRPNDLVDVVRAHFAGRPGTAEEMDSAERDAVAAEARRAAEAHADIIRGAAREAMHGPPECSCDADVVSLARRAFAGESTDCPLHPPGVSRMPSRTTPLNAPVADLIGGALGVSFVPDDAA